MLPSLYITSDGAYLPHLRPQVGGLQSEAAKLYFHLKTGLSTPERVARRASCATPTTSAGTRSRWRRPAWVLLVWPVTSLITLHALINVSEPEDRVLGRPQHCEQISNISFVPRVTWSPCAGAQTWVDQDRNHLPRGWRSPCLWPQGHCVVNQCLTSAMLR